MITGSKLKSKSLLSPQESLYWLLAGNWISQSVYVVSKLGIPDLLIDGPKTSLELANLVKAKPKHLYRILRALSSLDVFKELNNGCFANTAISKLLTSKDKNSLHSWAILCGEVHYKVWGNFLQSVLLGESAFKLTFGERSFDFYSKNEQISATFNQAMAAFSQMVSDAVVSSYDFSSYRKIVDVGGGVGGLISWILKANPYLEGVLFDMEHVIKEAEVLIEEEIKSKCKLIAGNFFELVPAGGDIYILKLIIHDWEDKLATMVLKNCHEAMNESSRLLVIDKVITSGDKLELSKFTDLNMMALTGGQERTEKEFRDLYHASGFKLVRIIPLDCPINFNMCIIEGVKN